jgi:uncharacterized protein with ATP-grasp and redox domains
MSICIDSRCLLCHFQKNLKTAQGMGDEEQATEFARGLMEIYLNSPKNVGATFYGPATDELFRRIYGIEGDRFKAEKEESNAFVLERMDRIRERVRSAPDPVFAGLQMAILGNYIDFSALYGEVSFEKLDVMLEQALEMELDGETYRSLCRDLEKGKKLLYLTDNAGEIGFDRICAEEIQRKFPHLQITFCVRGGPTLNDATRADAQAVGIPFPVIDNGNCIAGTQLELLGEEAGNAMETADVILAKGQANAETLLDSGYPIYYAFLIKCVRFIERFGKPKLTPMLLKEKREPGA